MKNDKVHSMVPYTLKFKRSVKSRCVCRLRMD